MASNSYQMRLVLSWIGVGANVTIVLFHMIVRIAEFFRRRKEKKIEEEKRQKLETLNLTNSNQTIPTKDNSTFIRLASHNESSISNEQSYHDSIIKHTKHQVQHVSDNINNIPIDPATNTHFAPKY